MNTTTMRSDRRKKPQPVSYEFLTFDECKALHGHCYILDRNGKIAQVAITSIKTWKTRPNELEVHCKFGLREFFKIRIDRVYNPNEELVRIVESES